MRYSTLAIVATVALSLGVARQATADGRPHVRDAAYVHAGGGYDIVQIRDGHRGRRDRDRGWDGRDRDDRRFDRRHERRYFRRERYRPRYFAPPLAGGLFGYDYPRSYRYDFYRPPCH
jgi:hypothetical protein